MISRPARRRRWLTPTSVALLAIALGFAGFYAGVREEKTQATGSASASSISRTAAARSNSSRTSAGTGAAPALGAAASGITAGTVTRVDGDTVYVKETSGATVQVKLVSSTAIKKTQGVNSRSVRPGDSVTIQGTQGSGGTITSTSVSDSGNNSTTTASSSQAAAATNSG
ncbi:MAG: hypothetical protein ACLP0L_11740 [Solirubrobacteraceae bacterium]